MIKKLLQLITGSPKEVAQTADSAPTRTFSHPKLPDWKTEIIETPQYWVETNYDRIDKLPPMAVKMVKKALDEGLIIDIIHDAVNTAAQLIRDTIVYQLKHHFTTDEGLWSVNFDQKTNILHVRMMPTEDRYWKHAERAWQRTGEVITGHGISVPNVDEKWDQERLRVELQLSLKQIKFDVASPVFWTVLHKNKDKTILWENKVWVPSRGPNNH